MGEYTTAATASTPALVIYIVDTSDSMVDDFSGSRRIDHVTRNLDLVAVEMVARSTKGSVIRPRYDVVIIGYADHAYQVLPKEVMPIDQLVNQGVPVFNPEGSTNTASGFEAALKLLRRELPRRMTHPAPMVCHLTDGESNGEDPEPFAREIMSLRNNDGPVLIENIYIGDGLTEPGMTFENWPGICSESEAPNHYIQKLFRMSSPIPPPIHNALSEAFPNTLREGARLLFPASLPEFVEVAFAISGLTGVGKLR